MDQQKVPLQLHEGGDVTVCKCHWCLRRTAYIERMRAQTAASLAIMERGSRIKTGDLERMVY